MIFYQKKTKSKEIQNSKVIFIIKDNRVHALLYFIPPNGHGLSEIDIKFMKLIGPYCNIIPVVAKSDSMNFEELLKFKKIVMKEIIKNNISIYSFPIDEDEDSEEG